MYTNKETVVNIIESMPSNVKFLVKKKRDAANNTDRVYLSITSDYYDEHIDSQGLDSYKVR